VEWLDDTHVMYHLTGASTAADVWSAAIDGETPPRLVLAAAYAPAVLRTTQTASRRVDSPGFESKRCTSIVTR